MAESPAAPASAPAPFVHINCAVSLDGRLAYADGARARFSGPEDLARVQRLRADSDAIVVGVGTVLRDDPSLRVHWELLNEPPGRSPFRVVLDSQGRTPDQARFLDGSQPTLVITARHARRTFPPHVETFATGETKVDLRGFLRYLAGRGVRRVLVEGGATVIAEFVRAGIFDRMTVFIAPVLVGGITAPPLLLGPESKGDADVVHLTQVDAAPLGAGILATYEPRNGRAPSAAKGSGT
jgi:2,5-diamino-6-(ribosylamino)-4(3H)-pyrimidinone 5'-phosphate reductase